MPRPRSPPLPARREWWLGMAVVGTLAAAAIGVAQTPWAERTGLGALTLAIVFGIVGGNTLFPAVAAHTGVGVDFAKGWLLRAGIVLYGLRITFQQIGEVGFAGVLIAALMVGCTFWLAVQLGTRVFKLDRDTAMLIGAGSSICGAAAVLATEPVLRAPAHKVSVAVATVVVFGTLAMFLYPLAYPHLGLSQQAYGLYTGSTVHEVAQVVAAGKAVGSTAEATAVIEKMLRVMMLAPFLLLLSSALRRPANGNAGSLVAAGAGGSAGTIACAAAPITIPWFAVLFVVVSGVNSLALLPAPMVQALVQVDTVLLAMAMAALGLRTHIGAVRQAGLKPLLLASTLFVFLSVGGYGINLAVSRWLG